MPVLITGGYDKNIFFWDVSTLSVLRTIPYTDGHINCMTISPTNLCLAAAGNPRVRFFDIENQAKDSSVPFLTFDGHTGNITALGFEQHGKWVYTASEDASVKIWDTRCNGNQLCYLNHFIPVYTAASPSDRYEVIFGDENGRVCIWDLVANRIRKTFEPEKGLAIKSVAASLDGKRLVAANHNGTVYTWLHQDGEYEGTRKIEAQTGHYVLKCNFSSDHLAIASADGTCSLWRILPEGYAHKCILRGHKRWVWDCIFTSSGSHVLTASSDCTCKLWASSTGTHVADYVGHTRTVTSLCVSGGDFDEYALRQFSESDT